MATFPTTGQFPSYGQVVFSSPPLVKLTSFENEFLRPTVAAEGNLHATTLDRADGKLDNKFYGASVANLATVPHNNKSLQGYQTTVSTLPTPTSFTSATTPLTYSSMNYSVTSALPTTSVLPATSLFTAPSVLSTGSGSVGRTLIPASPAYRGITSFQNEFLRPTVTAKTPAEAQMLDAADGRVDSRFYGATVFTH
eukprot:GGOE01055091.1.p1 GENE.GGOE01055091.1~~GGOE01055091.1.p1  ORF type:complete len:196 (+),score=3.59 GGOE01055091.1:30-617(+)